MPPLPFFPNSSSWRIKGFNRRLFLGVIFVFTLAAISLLPLTSTAQEIPDTLTLATSADYKPFEFHDTSSGDDKIVGFDIDIAERLAQELGFKLNVIDMDFNGLIPALQSKRADFVMAGMTPTPERAKSVDFSRVYYVSRNTIVAPKTSNLTTTAALTGKIVGVQLGSTQEEFAKGLGKKVRGMKIETRNRIPDLIQELKSRRIDAAIIEDAIARGYLDAFPDLALTVLEEGAGGSAIAFPKGSNLVAPFDKVLTAMTKDGSLERLAKKWFEDQGKTPGIGFERILPSVPFILNGVWVTLSFTLVSAALGLVWAIFLALAKIGKFRILRWAANIYTSVFRGTPLILQIALVYFATPQLIGYDIPAFQAGVIAFALNSGAYVSETLRAGIKAVDKGQWEAAESLGVPYRLMMTDVILPQALRNILPALANEAINLLKDSALVSTIGAADLLRRASIVGAEKYLYFEPLIIAGVVYYALVMLMTVATSLLEKRLFRGA
jgi:His/Glu/Gln/Arg/opine family amino acid ABC transporter permease subunit